MATLIAFMTAAFVGLAGLGIGASRFSKQESEVEQRTELTQDVVSACTDVCSQVAVLNGINSAESLCGVFGDHDPFPIAYTYEKCAKPEAVEGVTAKVAKVVKDFTAQLDEKVFDESNSLVNDILVSRAMEHGLDMSYTHGDDFTDSKYVITKEGFIEPTRASARLKLFGRDVELSLYNLKRVVNEGSDAWRDRDSCECLTQVGIFRGRLGGPRHEALPFCEANKDFPGCEPFLDIYGKCEKILDDAANKAEL